MQGMREVQSGDVLVCTQGTEDNLATTHRYTVNSVRRDENRHMQVTVKNSLGEVQSGEYPITRFVSE